MLNALFSRVIQAFFLIIIYYAVRGYYITKVWSLPTDYQTYVSYLGGAILIGGVIWLIRDRKFKRD